MPDSSDKNNPISRVPEYRLTLEHRLVGKFKKTDTTPSVEGVAYWIAQNTSPVTITRFKDGKDTHTLFVLGDGFTSIANNTYIQTSTGAIKLLDSGLVYVFVYMDGKWHEIAIGSSGGGGVPAGSTYVYYGTGSPEGVVTADVGDIYEQRDATNHPIWIKRSGTATNTGWRSEGGFSGTGSNSVAVGVGSTATQSKSTVVGVNSNGGSGVGVENVSLGYNISHVLDSARTIAIGSNANSTGSDNVIVGWNAVASFVSSYSIVIGSSAAVSATVGSITIGAGGSNGSNYSVALGFEASCSFSPNTFVIGRSGTHGIQTIRVGDDAVAAPDSVTFRVNNGFGTNIPGGTWTFVGSRGTGTGAPGRIVFQISTAGGSGTTLQTAQDRLIVREDGVDVKGTFYINGVAASFGGEANDGANLGTGSGVYSTKSGVTLQFKSLKAGTNITLTPSANEILIDAAATGEANDGANLGAGANVFASKSGVNLQFRSLVAGTGISVTQNANDITITNTGGSSGSAGGMDAHLSYAGF